MKSVVTARESALEDLATRYAESRGWLQRKIKYIGRRNAADRLFIRAGVVLFVEFKRKGAPPRPGQEREHLKLAAHGAAVHVIDNMEAAVAIFA